MFITWVMGLAQLIDSCVTLDNPLYFYALSLHLKKEIKGLKQMVIYVQLHKIQVKNSAI